MADVEAGQGAGAGVVATWRTPLETTALILLGALGFSIVGGIVSAVFTPGASAWRKLTFLGFNVVSIWHVAVLAIAVGLVLALRIPFAPDARGASMVRVALLGAAVLGAVIALSALIACIGAIGDNEAFVGLAWPEKIGNIMQWLGGAAVAGAVALLAVRSQGVVPAPARPAPAPAPPPPVAAPTAAPGAPGWAADPYGRHQWRYWDGSRWTDQVADGSTQSTDPAR
ncbi:MAG TPA: DUF2510 domain-containing protein [Acidimicrobiia bacterium]|jgi:hypothetical protein|nr:DUF2510 domain-containing protein [Acidimicrobiia bacterium]